MQRSATVYSRLISGFFIACAAALICMAQTLPAYAENDSMADAGRLAVIDAMLHHAIHRGLISGAAVVIGDHQGVLYEHATGSAGFSSGSPLLTTAAIFDVASLTKVFATSPAIVKLMDEGRVSLLDPVSRWFPEFVGSDITVLNLLTHTSGLHDVGLDPSSALQSAISRAAAQANKVAAGSKFLYADINFILLGELVRRISGEPLDRYIRRQFFQPLSMNVTGFNPAKGSNSAATIGRGNFVLSGTVQDENAQMLGGVAGHAGLFSSVHDLARFAGMLLNNGQLDGKRVLSARAVAQMTAPYFFSNGKIVRGLGWDRESPFSAPRGSLFSELSYGHTGYSGTSVWIDPEADLYVILLTTRLDYKNMRSFNSLRSSISTLAAALFAEKERRKKTGSPKNADP